MFFLYYCDYLYIFVLLLVFILNLLKNNAYIIFGKVNILNLFVIISSFMFIFLIIIILSLNSYSIDNKFQISVLVLFKLVFYFFSLIFLLFLKNYLYIFKIINFEHFFILFFTVFALSLFLQTNNFLSFYIILESYTLALSSVLVIKKLNKKLIEASFKYFVFNIISSCFLLLGVSNVYFSCGSLSFIDLNQMLFFYNLFYFKNIFNYGCILLFLGFLMKLAIFPFSLFLSEIYASLPNLYVFFLLIFPKFTFVVFLFNNIFIFLNSLVLTFILFFLILTSLLHAAMSTYSLNLKNIIINTSFANSPFIILPIFYKSVFLLNSFFNFISIYFFNLFCFFVIMLLITNKKNFIKKITGLLSIFSTNFSLAFLFISTLLSLSSLPPFSGFFAKLYFFYFFLEFKLYYIYFFLSIVNLLIIYTYLRVIRLFFIKKQNLYLKNLFIKKNLLLFFLCFITFFNFIFMIFFDMFYSIFFILLNYKIFI